MALFKKSIDDKEFLLRLMVGLYDHEDNNWMAEELGNGHRELSELLRHASYALIVHHFIAIKVREAGTRESELTALANIGNSAAEAYYFYLRTLGYHGDQLDRYLERELKSVQPFFDAAENFHGEDYLTPITKYIIDKTNARGQRLTELRPKVNLLDKRVQMVFLAISRSFKLNGRPGFKASEFHTSLGRPHN